jgi:predicted dehydrogenase
MKEWVEEGVIGEITSVEGRMVTSVVAQRNPGHWLFDHDKAGGGILHWLAIHTVDLIRYISGCEYASVCAMTATPLESIDVEEVASATFSLDNGALGQIHAGYLLPRRYGDIYLCMRGTRGDITWKIWGCEGRIDQLLVQSDVGAWADEEYREIHCPADGHRLYQRLLRRCRRGHALYQQRRGCPARHAICGGSVYIGREWPQSGANIT